MTDRDDSVPAAAVIQRQPARSERVSHGAVVVLHESSKTRVQLKPFFIPRSAGSELAVRLETYRKADPPMDWLLQDEKSISMKEPALRRLMVVLQQHLSVSGQNEDGQFIAIRLRDGQADLSGLDSETIAQAIVSILEQEDISSHLAGQELSSELVQALRGAIRLQELRSGVAELRSMLDAGETSEQLYQDWCERHTWAFGNAYVARDPIRAISAGDSVDLLLPAIVTSLRDIIELKRPDMEILRYDDAHKNYYFSADASKAIGQCHRYLDVLHEVAGRGLRDHPDVVAYHPRATVVLGRSVGWSEEKLRALHGLNSRLNHITMMSYDHLLAQGERLLSMVSPVDTGRESVGTPEDIGFYDDDLPF